MGAGLVSTSWIGAFTAAHTDLIWMQAHVCMHTHIWAQTWTHIDADSHLDTDMNTWTHMGSNTDPHEHTQRSTHAYMNMKDTPHTHTHTNMVKHPGRPGTGLPSPEAYRGLGPCAQGEKAYAITPGRNTKE